VSISTLGEGGAAPSGPTIDPREYEALRQRAIELEESNARATQFLNELEPYKDIVDYALNDREYADVMRNSIGAYRQMRESQKPQLPSEFAPLMEKVEGLDEIRTFVKELKTERESYATQQQQQKEHEAFIQKSAASVEKLSKKYPFLADNNWQYGAQFVNMARSMNMSVEDAVEQFAPIFRSNDPVTTAPTLRSGAGQTGVPASSAPNGDLSPGERLAQIYKKNFGA
jgi:hypothetical protein